MHQVLAQVDNKFIICVLYGEGRLGEEPLVVAIDQHAAHERVRLEHLQRVRKYFRFDF